MKKCHQLMLKEIYFLHEEFNGLLRESDLEELISFKNLEGSLASNPETLKQALKILYEIEYKYHMIMNKKFRGNPKRKNNILNMLEKTIDSLSEKLVQTFQQVLKMWLNMHGRKPTSKEWAIYTLQELEDNVVISEKFNHFFYFCKKYLSWKEINPALLQSQIIDDVFLNLSRMPATKKAVSEFKTFLGSDAKNLNEFKKQLLSSSPRDLKSFNKKIFSFSQETMKEFYQRLIYPIWYKMIDEENELASALSRIKKAFELSKKIANVSIAKKLTILNYLINVQHSTGSILDYYYQKFGVEKEFFDNLSNLNQAVISKWNEELREVGVEI